MPSSQKKTAPESYVEFLQGIDLFSGLDHAELEILATEFEPLELKKGETLAQQGKLSDALHILQTGKLQVTRKNEHDEEINLSALEPGHYVDEISLLIGEERQASIHADEHSHVLSLHRDNFKKHHDQYPKINDHFSRIIMDRFQKNELENILFVSDLFRDMNEAALNDLEEELELITCDSGEELIREGEVSDCAYIIISGRLRVSYNHPGKGEQILCELWRGHSVGEIAVITEGKRTATVRATRDSLLAKLTRDSFNRLLQKHPHDMMKHFAGKIITKLQSQTVGKSDSHQNILNIAIIPTSPEVSLTQFTQKLSEAVSSLGPTLYLNATLLDNFLSPAGIAETPLDDPNSINIARWLNRQESQYRFILYEADATQTEWTKRCVHQADRILLVSNAEDSSKHGEIEKGVLEEPTYQHIYKNLVLLHKKKPQSYHRTNEWLETREINNHYHVDVSDEKDFQRIARLLTGNGIGLVVSGGGARGFAHIGGIRALKEAGIPIDKIGGTSMGSIVAAMLAMDWDYEHMLKQATSFNYKFDYTFPAVSLTSGSNLTSGLMERLGEQQIEDLHLSFFCVSTDLSRSSQKMHKRGSLWKYVRASASIPGLFPPVIDKGSFLVDGGIVNNMPVDIMAKCDDIGTVIAFDVSGSSDLETGIDIDGRLSGWSVIASWMNPFTRSVTLPRLGKTLIHSSLTKSVEATEITKKLADLYIQFPVQKYGLVEFNKIKNIVETGYDFAKSHIEDQKKTLPFFKKL